MPKCQRHLLPELSRIGLARQGPDFVAVLEHLKHCPKCRDERPSCNQPEIPRACEHIPRWPERLIAEPVYSTSRRVLGRQVQAEHKWRRISMIHDGLAATRVDGARL